MNFTRNLLIASALLAKLEAATGPSRELDAAIAVAIFKAAPGIDLRAEAAEEDCEAGTYWLVGPSWRSLITSQRYSESLDAAMTLAAPPGHPMWTWRVEARIHGTNPLHHSYEAEITVPSHEYGGFAPTPALALCIAAVRARLAGQKE